MLYYKFRNYEEFKELFGIQHHENGSKSRKNKLLLSFIKNRELLHAATASGDYRLLHLSSMSELKHVLTEEIIRSGNRDSNLKYEVHLNGKVYRSAHYHTDNYQGVCEDGNAKAVRYVNVKNGRVFKMKAGKFYRKLIRETTFGRSLPGQVINYLCQEMNREWQVYVTDLLPACKLVIDRNFQCICNSISKTTQDAFYKNAVNASAARLENENGEVIACCVIYNEVRDQYGKTRRLAEQQYAIGNSDIPKWALVDALVKGGHIDGYKVVGTQRDEPRKFADIWGGSLDYLYFTIDCNSDSDNAVSYLGSFKNHYKARRIATNYDNEDIDFDTTYDSYHGCYCDEAILVYCDGSEHHCDRKRLENFIFVDEFGAYYRIDDIATCQVCGHRYLADQGCYSDLTEEFYCDWDCYHTAEESYKSKYWTFSDYDEDYFENADDVTKYMCWSRWYKRYEERTISKKSLADRIACGNFVLLGGVAFDVIDIETGRPYDD